MQQDQVIYQLYPKSFYDSNGDGIGDLRGIIQKLDYLVSLNVDMIWFNPFFVSPQNDSGYDVADYRAIDPRFGTMADFEELIDKLSQHHMGVMLDMVLNHTSTAHAWFQKALSGDAKYQAYYYLRDPKPNGDLPTNWQSKFGGPAWSAFGNTGKYYLHLYDRTQADLDWHNPEVRQEAAAVVNFWRAKGVRGFRFDVLNVIGKAEQLVDAEPGKESKFLYTDTPIVQTYIKELAANSFGQDPDSVTVGEMSSTGLQQAIAYTKPDNQELSMVFQFHHLKVDYVDGQKWTAMRYDFNALRKLLHTWGTGMAQGGGWQALFWNNHDQPRAIDRFADPKSDRFASATLLAASIHLSRGTPYIYMGEELGMSDPDYTSMDDYVDVEAHNAYKALLEQGLSDHDAFTIVHAKARDNSRTPMQWDDSATAGFTTGTPWLHSTNQAEVNVQAPVSQKIFAFYQKLITLHKQYHVISQGDYQPFGENIDWLYGYVRHYQAQNLLVLNNFADHEIQVPIPDQFQDAQVLITNLSSFKPTATITLPAYGTVALLH